MNTFVPPQELFSFAFRAFGATVRVESNDAVLLGEARNEAAAALNDQLEFLEPEHVLPDRTFGLFKVDSVYHLFEDRQPSTYGESRPNFIKFYNAILRIAVGEHSDSLTFLHAGVVSWKEKAIVLPANSFQGKTTFVAELVKLGAEYYSDEYAVIDDSGLVRPFARDLSFRTDGGRTGEMMVSVTSIGGRTGSKPIPIGTLLITWFEPGAAFDPVQLSLGTSIIETVPFAIPLLKQPNRTLDRLQQALGAALRIKSPRGEAREAADQLIAYIDHHG